MKKHVLAAGSYLYLGNDILNSEAREQYQPLNLLLREFTTDQWDINLTSMILELCHEIHKCGICKGWSGNRQVHTLQRDPTRPNVTLKQDKTVSFDAKSAKEYYFCYKCLKERYWNIPQLEIEYCELTWGGVIDGLGSLHDMKLMDDEFNQELKILNDYVQAFNAQQKSKPSKALLTTMRPCRRNRHRSKPKSLKSFSTGSHTVKNQITTK
jgi:hypothetical protein